MSLNFVENVEFVTDNQAVPNQPTSSYQLPAYTPDFLKTAKHPFICLFHLIFKCLSIFSFLFGSLIFGGLKGDYVITFVVTTILLAVDFWYVKNISGRFLVCMRWWNIVRKDGVNEWYFESFKDQTKINNTDKNIFWIALYSFTLIWICFFNIYIIKLKFEWVLLSLIGILISASNVVGYHKCYRDSQSSDSGWLKSQFLKSALTKFLPNS